MLTVVFLVTVVGGIAFVIGKQRFDLPGPLTEDKVVNVPRGGIRDTADLLMREGVIDQPNLFIAGALMLKAQNELKYGEYRFTRNASLRDVVDTIIEGKVVQHAFTIAEGLTSDQIVQRLVENETLTGNIRDVPREGTLLPETYRFTCGTTREQMIQRMQQAQQRAVQEIWDRRSSDLPIKTPEQLVTLASIVEKETGKPDERTRVAAVFVNRLRQKMKLQSDPTIIYGLVGGKGTLGRPIKRSEIEQPTPYNTYVIDGLPPGPIANPGRASLEAAANPARTKELFFVADGTGGHAFADNYEQHQKNVARLRVIEQQTAQPRAAQPTAPAFAPTQPAAGTPRRAAASGFVNRRRFAFRKPVFLLGSCSKVAAISRKRIRNTMALSSMTGFARGHGVAGTYAWAWELKSVNSKGLDLKLRLPPGWEAIEPGVRARARRAVARQRVRQPDREPRGRRGAGGAHQRAGAQRRARRAERPVRQGRRARRRASTASSRSRA